MFHKKKTQLGIKKIKDIEWIVGTDEGLQNLIHACKIALHKDEYSDENLGQFEGVKKVEEVCTYSFPLILKILLLSFNIVFFAAIVVGFSTIFQWLFQ